jgi:hypothetical protein
VKFEFEKGITPISHKNIVLIFRCFGEGYFEILREVLAMVCPISDRVLVASWASHFTLCGRENGVAQGRLTKTKSTFEQQRGKKKSKKINQMERYLSRPTKI